MGRRRLIPLHPAAAIILNRVGRGKLLMNEAELRERAALGANKLSLLKNNPGALDNLSLIRLADAAEVDPKEVARALGRPLDNKLISRIRTRRSTRRDCQTATAEIDVVRLLREFMNIHLSSIQQRLDEALIKIGRLQEQVAALRKNQTSS